MEPPFLVLRHEGRVLAAVPILELFQLQRAARMLMGKALSGDPISKVQVESVFAQALDAAHPDYARSVIATFLLRDALTEAEAIQEQQRAWAAQQAPHVSPEQAPDGATAPAPDVPPPPPGLCKHGRPTDIFCSQCMGTASQRTEAA